MKNLNPIFLIDYYKASHYEHQKDLGVATIFSTWTARSNQYHGECFDTVVFGHQAFVQEYFVELWQENFFSQDIGKLAHDFHMMMSNSFNEDYADFSRFEKLHELGYLPIEVWAVPEGTLLPIRMPQATIFNTHPDFGWLPQYLEDMWSCHNWLPSTSATTSYYRRKDLEPFFAETCDDPAAIRHICGDFSLRGMTGEQAAYASGLGHLLSFDRSATVGTNEYAREYYLGNYNEPVGYGVPALEHSVISQGIAKYSAMYQNGTLPLDMGILAGKIDETWELPLIGELLYIYTLLTKVQPRGNFTYVSDTNDYWGVITKILPLLKDVILARDGKFMIRPDSGVPNHMICGAPFAENWHQRVGTLALLETYFGATINEKGYKVLNPHIGLIYGDAITSDEALTIANRMKDAGWAINNIALGIGAYTFQYVTRDTRGYAIKATAAIFKDGTEIPLSKNPKTSATKKSARGAVKVIASTQGIVLEENLTIKQATSPDPQNLLRPIFKDGKIMNKEDIKTIRQRLWEGKF